MVMTGQSSRILTPLVARILVHEHDVYFASSEELSPEFDIEIATDHCVFQANLHHYVHNANTYTDPTMAT
jgi:hypothetical protein